MRTRYACISLLVFGFSHVLLASDVTESRFVGAPACSSTSCHGGAGERNQNLVWSKLDYHSRSYATLTSARSERFADVLKLGEAINSQRCTVCHAPFQTIDPKMRLAAARPSDGVSCESCHGPAENWLRSHTRPDFDHQDRVALGIRDLNNIYVRANTCVACHQTLDTDIAAAGHPDLIFELAGQTVSEPKHWRESETNPGPKQWFVGQAVALREMSWQLSQQKQPQENLVQRWRGLLWVLQQMADVDTSFHTLEALSAESSANNFAATQKLCDEVAQKIATMPWNQELTRKSLARLSRTSADFRDGKVSSTTHARRAERLVLGLDRLAVFIDDKQAKELNNRIDRLFKLVQSIPDFEPAAFADELNKVPSL